MSEFSLFVFLFCLVAGSSSYGQDASCPPVVQDLSSPELAPTRLNEGLPPGTVERGRSRARKFLHASIPAGEHAEAVHAVLEVNETGNYQGRVIVSHSDGDVLKVPIALERKFGNMLIGEAHLYFDRSSEMPYPVELRFLPSQKSVFYRWTGSTSGETAEGGAPSKEIRTFGVGCQAPSFTVNTLQGGRIRLDSLQGKVVVINTWTTTCGPCIAEMPGLNRLVDWYGQREDVFFLAITPESRKKVRAFLERREFRYVHARHTEETKAAFGGVVPRNVVIAPDGQVVFYRIGAKPDEYKRIGEVIDQHLVHE